MTNTEGILITGGFGNLGSWISRHLVEKGMKPTILSRTCPSFFETWEIPFLACDIREADTCRQVLGNKLFKTVIHLAAAADGFVDDYDSKALEVNVQGLHNVVSALDFGSITNFIYLSTFQVYGTYEGEITERTPARPKNSYGLSHLMAEEYLKMEARKRPVPFTIFRLTNSYGCPVNPKTTKWYLAFNDFCKQAAEKQCIQLHGDGSAQRDFIWMGEVCRVLEAFCQRPGRGETFHLAAGQTLTINDLAQKVAKAYQMYSGREVTIRKGPNEENRRSGPLHVSNTALQKQYSIQSDEYFKKEAFKIFEMLQVKQVE